jgi:hypothetical protein
MNDVNVAVENDKESSGEREFVELGNVSEETKGTPFGHFFDGGLGHYPA